MIKSIKFEKIKAAAMVWWQGEQYHLPILPEGFEIIEVRTWGHRIVRKAT